MHTTKSIDLSVPPNTEFVNDFAVREDSGHSYLEDVASAKARIPAGVAVFDGQ